MKKLLVCGFASLAWNACLATDAVPMAMFVLHKGYDKGLGFESGTAQYYDYNFERTCKGRKRLKKFLWTTGADATKEAAAGSPIFLAALVKRFDVGTGTWAPFSLNEKHCANTVVFTPVAGETYDIRQQAVVGHSCTISVVAATSNAPPPDLRSVEPLIC